MNELFHAAKAAAVLSGIGIYFAVVLGICIYAGHMADQYFNLDSTGKLIGILLGFPIGIYSTYRQIKRKTINP